MDSFNYSDMLFVVYLLKNIHIMKTIFLMLISISLSVGVSAQRKADVGERHENSGERNEYTPEYHSRDYDMPYSYGLGYDYNFGYPYYSLGYPYYGYPYYGYPSWYGRAHNRNKAIQYKLSLQIKSIKMDYQNKIKQVRHDRSLSHSQKIQKIRTLKTDRGEDIVTAEKDFVKQLNMGNPNLEMMNSQKSRNGNATS